MIWLPLVESLLWQADFGKHLFFFHYSRSREIRQPKSHLTKVQVLSQPKREVIQFGGNQKFSIHFLSPSQLVLLQKICLFLLKLHFSLPAISTVNWVSCYPWNDLENEIKLFIQCSFIFFTEKFLPIAWKLYKTSWLLFLLSQRLSLGCRIKGIRKC